MNLNFSFFGYAGAAAAFAVFTLMLLTIWRPRARGSLLALASLVSTAWAACLAAIGLKESVTASYLYLIEMSHDVAWLFCLSSFLGGAVAAQSNWVVRRGGVLLGAGLLLAGLVLEFGGLNPRFPNALGQLLVLGSIATSLYALVGIEQLYRNARPKQQNGLKFLCLGLAGIFAYDLFLYSNAIVDGQIGAVYWSARGYVVALCVPLIAVSVQRISSWSSGIFASRQIVFYTTTLFAAGIYLTLIGFAGYYIQTLSREWGDALQLIFFSASILAFFALIMSEQLRARIRVWLTKHFFERKYDYRAEWLRLIHTLTTMDEGLPLKKKAIKSLAQIIDSQSGYLWLKNKGSKRFEAVSSWNVPPVTESIEADSQLLGFLSEKGWILDVSELTRLPGKYEPLTVTDLTESLANSGFVIPLIHEGDLVGFVAFSPATTPVTLNFEDYDLLKTAGQQVASYLVQEEATEQLAESRQFEAFNQFTAFVMHDLKNAIAQQLLVVENAERHKRNPEFIDDAMETIKGSIKRMRRVMAHLRQGAVDQPLEHVDVTKLLLQAQSRCADRRPIPNMRIPETAVMVQANRERLLSAFSHAIRNAQDACDADDKVSIELDSTESACAIRVVDTGSGMDADFLRNHLFKPFESTKGAEGMGIGAYQIRETLRAFGGDVEVESEIGMGTTVIMHLPLAGKVTT